MNKAVLTLWIVLILLPVAMSSCKSQAVKDAEARTKIESQLAPGAMVEVENGVATLSGTFPDEASRSRARVIAGKVPGVKTVIDQSKIPPSVTVSPDRELTDAVREAVAIYPGVLARVEEGVITLTGAINRAELPDLMQTLNALSPQKIDNQLELR